MSSQMHKINEFVSRPGRLLQRKGLEIEKKLGGVGGFVFGLPIYITGQHAENVGRLAGFGLYIPISIYTWAFRSSEIIPELPNQKLIENERGKESFERGRIHVAICGQAGNGKSSIVNALRGIMNSHDGAAHTGTIETTTSKTAYATHESIPLITLRNIPGGGTRRMPAENYYRDQKLHIFHLLLIVHSDRLGQVSAWLILIYFNKPLFYLSILW